MAPSLSEEEIDDLVYLARVGDDADLTKMLQELSVRDTATPADILTAAREEQGKATCLHMAAANGHASKSLQFSALFHRFAGSASGDVGQREVTRHALTVGCLLSKHPLLITPFFTQDGRSTPDTSVLF